MFKYSCFIENTPEAREWLESIGYKKRYLSNVKGLSLMANEGYYSTFLPCIFDSKLEEDGCVNCLGNLSLFKALTAVRDDSDYMQWFYSVSLRMWILNEEQYSWKLDKIFFHKATKEELIEKFK